MQGNGNRSLQKVLKSPPDPHHLPRCCLKIGTRPWIQRFKQKTPEKSLPGESLNYIPFVRWITTFWVVVVGDSLLGGTESPIHQPVPSHREVCCLPGAQVQENTRSSLSLSNPLIITPLMIAQPVYDEVDKKGTIAIKNYFKALG